MGNVIPNCAKARQASRSAREMLTNPMIPEIGHFALILALLVALVQSTLPLIGAARRDPAWLGIAPASACAGFILISVAFASLIWCYVTSDFSVLNVVE